MAYDPSAFLSIPRKLPKLVPAQVRVNDYDEIYGRFEATEAADQAARCLDCGNPYCSWQCPVHNHIPRWLELARDGRILEAAELAYQTNPLPEICGTVCPQDRLCEGACTLEEGFGAVTIGQIERHITIEARAQGFRPDLSRRAERAERVAVIGAGPAGLACADRLRLAGVQVTVFDRYPEIGGLLTFGIPAFKLDKALVRARRDELQALGVRFELGVEIGRDLTLDALLADYDALFVAIGAYRFVNGALSGSDLAGVHYALPYLIDNTARMLDFQGLVSGAEDLRDRRVIVLGGGDTGMDCVRTAVRQGAREVHCLYRRSREQMPGSRREVERAIEEGVQFHFNWQPLAIEGTHGRVSAVRAAPTRSAGRGQDLTVDAQQAQQFDADAVVLAFGFRPSPPAWLLAAGVQTHADGRVIVDSHYRTTHPRIYAGGDMTRGADLVVTAVAEGRDAGLAIAAQLTAPASQS